MAVANIVLRGLAAGTVVIPFILSPAASFLSAAETAVDVAHHDRTQLSEADYNCAYYFTTAAVQPAQRAQVVKILAFTCASLSSNQQLAEQLPFEVRNGLYRILTNRLGWQSTLPKLLKQHYPYTRHEGELPLVIRADWFIQFFMDQTKSNQAYFELLFGKEINNTDELLKLLGADQSSDYTYGWIEENSRVSVHKVRLLTTIPTLRRTDLWHTFDYERIDEKTDPLENLTRGIRDGKHDHQASELIFALPKSIPGGVSGTLQGYALANGEGAIQTVAPTSIVVDNTNTRGVEIINPLSCVACHVEGLRPPSTNALREYLKSGAEAYINDYEAQRDVDRFHLTEISKWIERANEDYELAVQACNGYTAAENAQAFIQVIREYDRDLTLADAARELYVAPEVLQNALGFWTSAKKRMPARLAALAHGGTINRESWEGAYRDALVILSTWDASQ